MIRLFLLVLVAMCSATPGEYDLRFVPRVMFWCGKVNQHIDLSTGEWTTDADGVSGCIPFENKAAILDYCRKVYPTKHVSNVVEANSLGESHTWCERGNENCNYYGRKPAFQCIVGHFESRALNVPDSCHFSHYYDHTACLDHDRLHQIASQQCQGTTPVLSDYEVIIECGLDQFRGVEYVCCPEADIQPTEPLVATVTEKPEEEKEIDEILTSLPSLISGDTVDVDTLSHTLDFEHHCERKSMHGLYAQQRGRLDETARGRMGLLLKQYQRAMAAAGKLKERNGKTAEMMLERIKEKFRKMVVDSERKAAVDHRKLKGMHAEDLKECYDERLCKGLQMFMMVLAEKPTEARDILDGVNRVLERELDDHRVAATAPRSRGRDAERERHHTMERIQKQIDYAKDFLAVATKALEEGTATFPHTGYECPLSEVATRVPETELTSETGNPKGPIIDFPMEPGPVILPEEPVVTAEPTVTEPVRKDEVTDALEDDSKAGESEKNPIINFPMEPGPVILPEEPVVTAEPTVGKDEITDILVDDVIHKEDSIDIESHDFDKALDSGEEWRPAKKEGLAHAQDNNDERFLSNQKSSSSGSHVGMAVGLAVGAVVMIGTVVLVFFVVRRSSKGSYEVSLVGEEETARREEDALQESGYENPAYKFFEEMDDEEIM